jgi:hypothetical protein
VVVVTDKTLLKTAVSHGLVSTLLPLLLSVSLSNGTTVRSLFTPAATPETTQPPALMFFTSPKSSGRQPLTSAATLPNVHKELLMEEPQPHSLFATTGHKVTLVVNTARTSLKEAEPELNTPPSNGVPKRPTILTTLNIHEVHRLWQHPSYTSCMK